MAEVKFVSYDGHYPCLCSGTLILQINGKKIKFPSYCMISGGGSGWDSNGTEYVESGDWSINFDEIPELEKYKKEILECINANVPHGCCGGFI